MKAFILMNCNGKALVKEDGDDADLVSYETTVAFKRGSELFRAEGQPQSVTTAKHMREFAMLYGFPRMTKAELTKLPVMEV